MSKKDFRNDFWEFLNKINKLEELKGIIFLELKEPTQEHGHYRKPF